MDNLSLGLRWLSAIRLTQFGKNLGGHEKGCTLDYSNGIRTSLFEFVFMFFLASWSSVESVLIMCNSLCLVSFGYKSDVCRLWHYKIYLSWKLKDRESACDEWNKLWCHIAHFDNVNAKRDEYWMMLLLCYIVGIIMAQILNDFLWGSDIDSLDIPL